MATLYFDVLAQNYSCLRIVSYFSSKIGIWQNPTGCGIRGSPRDFAFWRFWPETTVVCEQFHISAVKSEWAKFHWLRNSGISYMMTLHFDVLAQNYSCSRIVSYFSGKILLRALIPKLTKVKCGDGPLSKKPRFPRFYRFLRFSWFFALFLVFLVFAIFLIFAIFRNFRTRFQKTRRFGKSPQASGAKSGKNGTGWKGRNRAIAPANRQISQKRAGMRPV